MTSGFKNQTKRHNILTSVTSEDILTRLIYLYYRICRKLRSQSRRTTSSIPFSTLVAFYEIKPAVIFASLNFSHRQTPKIKAYYLIIPFTTTVAALLLLRCAAPRRAATAGTPDSGMICLFGFHKFRWYVCLPP